MVPIRKLLLLLLVSLLVLTACGRPASHPAPTTPPPSPVRSTPPSPAALPSVEGSTLHVAVGGKATTAILVGGRPSSAGLEVSAKRIMVYSSQHVRVGLPNPFGGAVGKVTLQPFLVSKTHHLLLTMTDGRVTQVYVLVPGAESLKVALKQRVDWGAEVVGDGVKLSARTYTDDGAVVITSHLYQYNPKTRQYEKAPA